MMISTLISLQLPTNPSNYPHHVFSFLYFIFVISHKIQLVLSMCHGCGTIHWNTGILSVAKFLRNNDLFFLRKYQLPIVPQ